jgi:hypothetical protein
MQNYLSTRFVSVCVFISVDATMSDGIARYCNDEVMLPNAIVKKTRMKDKIHLCLRSATSKKGMK